MKTSEINPARNEHDRLWRQFNRESLFIVLVAICCIMSIASHLRADRAIDDAKEANIRSQMQTETIQGLEGDINVYRIRAAKIDAWLKAHGVPPEEIYNDR